MSYSLDQIRWAALRRRARNTVAAEVSVDSLSRHLVSDAATAQQIIGAYTSGMSSTGILPMMLGRLIIDAVLLAEMCGIDADMALQQALAARDQNWAGDIWPEVMVIEEDMDLRQGRFAISQRLINDKPEVAQQILADVVIRTRTFDRPRRAWVYEGYSRHFRQIGPTERAPIYEIDIHTRGSLVESITWREQNVT
jgi:hypothetical protein